jgi:hypothetical protein
MVDNSAGNRGCYDSGGANSIHFHINRKRVVIYKKPYFISRLEFVGHSFAYVAHFVFLRDVWIRSQRADVAT